LTRTGFVWGICTLWKNAVENLDPATMEGRRLRRPCAREA